MVIWRIGWRLKTPSTTPITRPSAMTGSPITIIGSFIAMDTIGTEIIGVPCSPR